MVYEFSDGNVEAMRAAGEKFHGVFCPQQISISRKHGFGATARFGPCWTLPAEVPCPDPRFIKTNFSHLLPTFSDRFEFWQCFTCESRFGCIEFCHGDHMISRVLERGVHLWGRGTGGAISGEVGAVA